MDLINLRSDTQSQPSARMRQAMAAADTGDDSYGESSSVRELESRVADLCGCEASLLVVGATMANLIALMLHARPGGGLYVDGTAHVIRNEVGGVGAVAGLVPIQVLGERGHYTAAALEEQVAAASGAHPRPSLAWLENTHNLHGGSVLPFADLVTIAGVCRRLGLALHMDGARLVNAAAAQRRTLAELAEPVDSLTLDLSKGLGCPFGALLLGRRGFVDQARQVRRMLGGGIRKAGPIAAAGLVALDDNLARAPIDNELARRLGSQIQDVPGLVVDAPVETNIVYARIESAATALEAADALRANGVLASVSPPRRLRFVTYLDITAAQIDEAARRISAVFRGALGAPSTRIGEGR